MKNVKLWLTLLLVLVAGFLAGVVVTRAVTRKYIQQAAVDPNRVREAVARRMFSRLDLQPDQRAEVGAILKDTQVELRSLRTEFSPRYVLVMSNAEFRIKQHLTPEQVEKFRKFSHDNRQLWMPR